MFTVSWADEVVRQAGRGVLHAARSARGAGVESLHGLVAGGRRRLDLLDNHLRAIYS